MLPPQLKPSDFASYPPQAQHLAVSSIGVLQRLPLAFLPIFLRELITYDWKLPAERMQIESQLNALAQLAPDKFAATLQPFTALRLSPTLEAVDWVAAPSAFVEQLTAFLWATNQMDAFRAAADAYNSFLNAAAPAPAPAQPRLVIVVIGQGARETRQPLFTKLRSHGVYCNAIHPEDGLSILIAHAARRAKAAAPNSFAHWYIDGGVAAPSEHLMRVSYASLAPARAALLDRTRQTIASGESGPEALRTLLAAMRPEDIGLRSESASPDFSSGILNHFQLSLLTEGSGTQIFATTFVQWAGREVLRRAQPETLLLRYAPRQQQQAMNAMLAGAPIGGNDPEGSLIDAEMGAYYTWLELQRLTGADQARFLVWLEAGNQAVAIGPGLPHATVSESPMTMTQLLSLLT
ncbi:MAG: hypothetical protein HIU93_14760 [Acidobacteria bacterium]|nr:hypothetical protein [Acidobacteriota bacterium]